MKHVPCRLLILILAITTTVLVTLSFLPTDLCAQIQMAPDGTFVYGRPQMAPDGTFVGGRPQMAPDGTFVGGRPQMAPDGTFVGGRP